MKKSPFKRFIIISIITVLFVLMSSTVYYLIGNEYGWAFFDCLYFTVVTVTTIGYGETIDFSKFNEAGKYARYFTLFVMLWGMATYLFFVSSMTELLVTGAMHKFFRRRRMKKMISTYNDHYILCGYGEMGSHVVKELFSTYNPVVVIDKKIDIIDQVEQISSKIPVIIGDASEAKILEKAGIERAKGVVLTLPSDKENLFAIVTVRSLNPSVRIASKCVHVSAKPKLELAGADKVILPAEIGGMRMASELIRPSVVTFIDMMLRDKDSNLRIEEVLLSEDMSCINQTLKESMLRSKANVLVMAIEGHNDKFIYNPPADVKLTNGSKLIVLGKAMDIARFKKLI